MLSVPALQVVRYYSCSAIALAIDLTAFGFAVRAGMAPWLAAAVSYAAAIAVHFVLNRKWTFRGAPLPLVRQMVRYAAVVGVAWAFTVIVVAALTGAHMQPFHAKLAAVVLGSPFGFLGHKYVTYRGAVNS